MMRPPRLGTFILAPLNALRRAWGKVASGTIDLVINTPTKGRRQDTDGFHIRRATVEHSVGCVTAIDTARAMLTVREQGNSAELRPIDITKI